MDLTAYRNSPAEQDRIRSLLGLIPARGRAVLDVGARDGYLSVLLTDHFDRVTALDLEEPAVHHSAVDCIKGDVCSLRFPDNSFDLVVCAEVLEHIPTASLQEACAELLRVAAKHVLIGVPYRQDSRAGRTTCGTCGQTNPPWGHVNTFNEVLLHRLFAGSTPVRTQLVGANHDRTNPLSTLLMDLAGNPYGTYSQEEPCVHCGARLTPPGRLALAQKLSTHLALALDHLQSLWLTPTAQWIHVLFAKAQRC